MKIDIHAHYLPADSLKVVQEIGRRYQWELIRDKQERAMLSHQRTQTLGPLRDEFHDIDLRLKTMDRSGIDVQALSAQNSFFLYWMEPEEGLEFAQWLNERFASVVEKYPERFVALAHVPLQDTAKAVLELERAVKKLRLSGVQIGSNINGRYFDDPAFSAFWEAAQALDVLIFVHPTQVVGAERMKDYNLANLIGNPTETSLALARCIFGGVLERFPRLKFCLSHAGGFLPYTWGRLDRGYKAIPGCREKISRPPGEYVKLFYFDTISHSGMALEYLVQNFGVEHVLLGSDFPFEMGDPEPWRTVDSLGIAPGDKQRIAGDNAAKLLGIGR
ncbi:MAG: amidohydrolase [Deltaproteobacteria bacterium]|nr:amidohydrolase [Deltaproteobacteria bacterium]